jgi:membrane-bound lytic murein transglycosylase D
MIRSFFISAGIALLPLLSLMAGDNNSGAGEPTALSDNLSHITANLEEPALHPVDLAPATETNGAEPEGLEGLLDQEANQVNGAAEEDSTVFIIGPDDPIVAMLDSLSALKVFRKLDEISGEGIERHPDISPAYIPTFPDSVYRQRIERMNDNSPFEFVFNGWVKSYIDLYGNRRKELTERMLGLGSLYFPFFEEQLDRYNLPLELKYLAVIESALNPVARSRAGATGIWQFMYHTGRLYGLNTSSYVDDRNDVTLATIAACQHMVDLYNIYQDWSLVLAAYNAGPGNVNRAIRRAGGVRDFWLIRPYLPRETQNYVPAFIAVAYVMEHAEHHNLFPVPPIYTHLDIDTIHVKGQLSLRTISELLNVSLDNLRFLNPAYRHNIIPKREDNPYVLFIPKEFTGTFIANEEKIYNFRTPEQIRQEELARQLAETTVYVVVRGDNLGSIARRHGTSVSQIQAMNNLRGTTIHPGQRLIVRAPAPSAAASSVSAASSSASAASSSTSAASSSTSAASSSTSAASSSTSAGEGNVHVVRRGETLGIIASRYRISVSNLMQWNNLTGTVIHPGQQLVVRPPSGA